MKSTSESNIGTSSINILNVEGQSRPRSWSSQVLTTSPGGSISLTLSNQNLAHLSFWDNAQLKTEQLFYAQQTGSVWQTEIVAATHGAQSAIGLTRAGQPLIAYFDLDQSQLMLARKSASGWEAESITPDEKDFLVSFAPGALHLVMDSQDRPIISFYNNDALKLAQPHGAGWEIETLVAGAGAGFFHDLVLDSQGNPVIAYHLLGKQELHLLRRIGGVIEDELVDATPNSGEYVSLALDANDQAHLCCWQATGLIYFTKSMNGGEWQSEQVDAEAGNQGLGLYCKIGVSRTGIPKIAYYDGHNGRLKFAHRNQDSTWVIDTVDDGGGSTGDAGGYIAMKLNALGLAQIAYYDWGTQEIKFTQEPSLALGCLKLLLMFWNWFVALRKRTPNRSE